MRELSQEFIFFNDDVGRTLPRARLRFLDSDGNEQDVYSTKELDQQLRNPVIAGDDGIFPQIWMLVNTEYVVELYDEDGVFIRSVSGVNLEDMPDQKTLPVYFETFSDMAVRRSVNGETISLNPGQVARCLGADAVDDRAGREFLMVFGQDETENIPFVINIDNGNQAKKLDNYRYNRRVSTEALITLSGAVTRDREDVQTGFTIASAQRTSLGNYTIIFSDTITNIDFNISPRSTDVRKFKVGPTSLPFVNSIFVSIFDMSGTLIDDDFYIEVTGSLS